MELSEIEKKIIQDLRKAQVAGFGEVKITVHNGQVKGWDLTIKNLNKE